MTRDKKETKSFTLNPEVADELDELGNASKVVNDLLKEYFLSGGDGPIALELKLQEKEKRLNEAMDERDQINRRIERLRKQKEQIEHEIEQRQSQKRKQIEEAADYVYGKPPDNPAVQNWAEKIGMTPNQLKREVEELKE